MNGMVDRSTLFSLSLKSRYMPRITKNNAKGASVVAREYIKNQGFISPTHKVVRAKSLSFLISQTINERRSSVNKFKKTYGSLMEAREIFCQPIIGVRRNDGRPERPPAVSFVNMDFGNKAEDVSVPNNQ